MNAVLGLMNMDPDVIFIQLEQFLPSDVASLVSDYLAYIGQNNSIAMLVAGAVLIMTSASAAFRLIVRSSYDFYSIKSAMSRIYYLISVFMPIILVVVIYISAIIVLTGNWFFSLIETFINLSVRILYWDWLRFLLLFLIVFLFLALVYRSTRPKLEPDPPILPGAFAASVSLVIVSIIFSKVMGASSKYSIVYGSLTSLMVLMLWLYMISTILFLGNAFNYVIYCSDRGEGVKLE